MKLRVLLQVLSCIALCGGFVHANANEIDGTTPSADEMKSTAGADGWSQTLKFSGTGSLAQHSSHLTETNGSTYNVGAKLDGALNWRQGSTEWRNTLLIDEGTQKNPAIDSWSKTSDVLKIESIYLWALEGMPMLGPYAKATFDTALFKNDKYFADATIVNGAAVGVKSYRLTDGFLSNPMTLKGSLGVFYKAIDQADLNVEVSAGVGGMRVWAKGETMSEDSNNAGQYLTTELTNFTDFGLVLGLSVKGKLDAKTSYALGFESLTPLSNDDDLFPALSERSIIEITNYDLFAKIDTQIYDFLSLGYEFRMKKLPKLQYTEQISNLLNVSLTYIFL